jgi:inner membrane protein
MPTILTHAVVALGVGKAVTGRRRLPRAFWVLSAGLAMAPDIDVVAWAVGIPYRSVWGHRGITHSLAAALLAALVVARLTRRPFGIPYWPLVGYFFVVTASHGVLDAFTNGGEGVAFFAPFDTDRYFFPWRPVRVSPVGLQIFTRYGARVLRSEVVWIWVPTGLLVGLAVLGRALYIRLGRTGGPVPEPASPTQAGMNDSASEREADA